MAASSFSLFNVMKPSIVIDKNGVNITELRKNNLGVDDLIESIRAMGYFSLDDLSYAIFESNGKLSPMENTSREETPSSLPVLVVDKGKVVKDNVKKLKTTEKNSREFLLSKNCPLKHTEVLTIDGNGRCYIKKKSKKYFISHFELCEGVKW